MSKGINKKILISSVVLGGVDRRDHPDYVDAYIDSATWEDGTPLTEEELDAAQEEYGDVINELANEGAWQE